ncbi:uncharacterized protein LOC122939551 [Bufo gargarizans]|uniref:uncharacterized protein LOC122939551 n=1 Tax=Bufo gargarizans TaxID=30331 RepID=UPI001CF21A92|nr:uncharacterized protein LOC122939551 [Bufo gargarizans]
MLNYLRKPSVVQNLMVKDWLERKDTAYFDVRTKKRVCIVKTQGTAIALTDEEELLFSTYFKHIRPTQLTKESKTVEQFFVSCKGKPVTSPCNDSVGLRIIRYYIYCLAPLKCPVPLTMPLFMSLRFQIPAVTGKEAKEAFDQCADGNLCQEDREIGNNYIHLDICQLGFSKNAVIQGMQILTTLRGANETESSEQSPKKRRREGENQEEEEEEEGEGGVESTASVSQPKAQYCLDKWRRTQYRDRIKDVVGIFRAKSK